MPRIALYAGSFDPVTNGHIDVVRHAVRLADRLVLAVGVHPGKAPLFSVDERLAMLEETCAPIARDAKCEMSCITFDNCDGGVRLLSGRNYHRTCVVHDRALGVYEEAT